MPTDESAKPRRQTRAEARAWRLMGLGFERLLHSAPAEHPESVQAVALAQWIYANWLTEDEKTEFTHQTGWIMDRELALELMGPEYVPAANDDGGDDDIPF